MSRKMSWSAVCLLAAGSSGWAAEWPVEGERTVLVRLYNPAEVEGKELSGAVAEATWILGKAGIRADWVLCEPQAPRGEGDRCRETGDRWAVSLGVIAKAPDGMKDHALAFTLLQTGAGNHAAVLHGRVKELVRSCAVADRGVVLAAAMAHEIGHALSGSAQHASRGLMRARWGKAELLQMGQRRLLFGEAEAASIRGRLRAEGAGETPAAMRGE